MIALQSFLNVTSKESFLSSLPVVAGYYTVAFVFGMMCVEAGLPLWFPILMCLFVYAGASQFAALSLITIGTPISTILITTLIINARHLLMSVYMSEALKKLGLSRGQRLVYAFGLTDESFAMHSNRLSNGLPTTAGYLIGFNAYCHFSWVLGGLTGGLVSSYASQFIHFRLDYALTAMMIYVLVSLCNTRIKLYVVIVSIMSTIGINMLQTSPLNIFAATLIGCGVGLCLKKRS